MILILQLDTFLMQKQESSFLSKQKPKQTPTLSPSCLLTNTPETSFFPSKNQFVEWLKGLSTEERYLAVQAKVGEVNSSIRDSFKRFQEEKNNDLCKSEWEQSQKGKYFQKQSKALIQGLVFMSGENYLDTLGFDFNLIECPQKIYDILISFKQEKGKKNQELQKEKKMKSYNFQSVLTKEDWLFELVRYLKKNLARMYNLTWNPQILDDEKFRKRQFSFYWKSLNNQQKLNILYLDCFDSKQLLLKLIDMDVPLNPNYLQTEIEELMKLDKNQFCNKIFKCKLKKCSLKIYKYYGLVYNKWKESVEKSRKKRTKKIPKKKNKKTPRNRSLGGYSNETNQTQYKEEKFDIDIHEISMNKLQHDINDCSDWISDRANQFFDRRVLAFERVQGLLQFYQTPIKLYGSCASGITLENSDIDIAIDNKILYYFQNYSSVRNQLEAALECLSEFFSQFSWIGSIKLLSKATVPLIKLTIDTQVPVLEQFFQPEYKKKLNRTIKKGGKVCVDLTIQTKNQDFSSNHLGIISTATINEWLSEIPTLRPIILILKYHLAQGQLNQTYSSGLNTYGLIVMVIAFLRHGKLCEEKNIAKTMSKLLNFYGWEFDEKMTKIDLLQNEIFSKIQKKENIAALEVYDPLCQGRNMTKNCYRFDEIKQMMRRISKKCISRTVNEVEELCSLWNPKEVPMTNSQLYEMVRQKLKENYFICQLK